jgi:hypothetical protein
MAAIGLAWADGAWVEAGWAANAWSQSYTWTLADRHTLHRLPVAVNYAGNLEYSSRLALANVPLANAATDTNPAALSFEVDDDFALLYMPHPVGWTVVTRSGLTVAPRVLESDSINRDGDLVPTLSGFTPSFTGTFVAGGIDGDLDATISGFSASFTGTFAYRHYFNIGYSVTPTWVVYAQPAAFGDVDITIGGFVPSVTGTALPPNSTTGSISSTMSGFTPDFDGTFTSASTFTGSLSADIESFVTSYRGTAVPTNSSIGEISTTISGFTNSFTGTFAVWNTDGDMTFTLGAFNLSIEGAFIDASAIYGFVDSTLSSFSFDLDGTVSKPGSAGAALSLTSIQLYPSLNGTRSLYSALTGTRTLN